MQTAKHPDKVHWMRMEVQTVVLPQELFSFNEVTAAFCFQQCHSIGTLCAGIAKAIHTSFIRITASFGGIAFRTSSNPYCHSSIPQCHDCHGSGAQAFEYGQIQILNRSVGIHVDSVLQTYCRCSIQIFRNIMKYWEFRYV